MIRRPPRSTLFPTRRSSDLGCREDHRGRVAIPRRGMGSERGRDRVRSEEHTSELQSRRDLVCRLLLEKKKQENNAMYTKKPPMTASRPDPAHACRTPPLGSV